MAEVTHAEVAQNLSDLARYYEGAIEANGFGNLRASEKTIHIWKERISYLDKLSSEIKSWIVQ